MLDSIKHGLRNLANFNGRDARQTFWYYVLFVYILTTLFSMMAMIPALVAMFGNIVDTAKAGGSPDAAEQVVAASMSELFGSVGYISMAVGVAFILALAASLVRRLHDSDMSGWWAVLPGALQAYGIVQMPAQLAAMGAVMGDPAALNDPTAMYRAQGSAGLLGWLAIGLVVWFGVRKSTPGPNVHGDAPVRF